MAVSTELLTIALDTAGVTADVSTQPADNCHTIIVYNTDATNAALVGIVANGTGLTTANAGLVPAGGSLQWRIGTAAHRPFGAFTAATRVLRLAAVAGNPVIQFQYVNSAGAAAP